MQNISRWEVEGIRARACAHKPVSPSARASHTIPLVCRCAADGATMFVQALNHDIVMAWWWQYGAL